MSWDSSGIGSITFHYWMDGRPLSLWRPICRLRLKDDLPVYGKDFDLWTQLAMCRRMRTTFHTKGWVGFDLPWVRYTNIQIIYRKRHHLVVVLEVLGCSRIILMASILGISTCPFRLKKWFDNEMDVSPVSRPCLGGRHVQHFYCACKTLSASDCIEGLAQLLFLIRLVIPSLLCVYVQFRCKSTFPFLFECIWL